MNSVNGTSRPSLGLPVLPSQSHALGRRGRPSLIEEDGSSVEELDPGPFFPSLRANIAIIAGVIAAVAIVLICLLIVMLRYMYRHKGTYHTNEAKGTEFAESADAALQDDPSLQDTGDNSRKEYFI
ncbi:glycophorin-C isoform X1 [Enhydra lutris kenyoni]|uniref:Glycophorin-C isoform X1 n=1 Tax=Enhydra lutris kenyoni TaxID=391180 RepID=A0A2Y9L0V5_ENHLU|nr:glycophorin-C isoform X1 [Enhydra lutris kenyoni]